MKTKPYEMITVLSVCAALLIVFYFADLSISIALYNPQSAFGSFFKVAGELPCPICGILSGATLLFHWKGRTGANRFWKKLFAGVVWAFSAALYAFLLLGNLNMLTPLPAVAVAAAVAIIGLLTAWRIPADLRANAVKVALVGALLVVSVLIVFNLMKMGWGRERFHEMLPPYEGFSAWPFPQKFTADNAFMSFPSGHAAQSSTILMITLLPCLFSRLWSKRMWLYLIAYAWIVPVCLSRVIMGAHFASDVVVGFLITYLLFQFWKYVFIIKNEQTAKRSV